MLGSATRSYPLVNFFLLEFPEPPHAMRRHLVLINPLVYGVAADPEVIANLTYGKPAIFHLGHFSSSS
jgi:hypothetical protein